MGARAARCCLPLFADNCLCLLLLHLLSLFQVVFLRKRLRACELGVDFESPF